MKNKAIKNFNDSFYCYKLFEAVSASDRKPIYQEQ